MNIKRFRLGSDWSNRMIIYANVTKKKKLITTKLRQTKLE